MRYLNCSSNIYTKSLEDFKPMPDGPLRNYVHNCLAGAVWLRIRHKLYVLLESVDL